MYQLLVFVLMVIAMFVRGTSLPSRGELVENNARLVARTVRIARELEREPATPDEARAMLGLRGRVRGELPARAVAV